MALVSCLAQPADTQLRLLPRKHLSCIFGFDEYNYSHRDVAYDQRMPCQPFASQHAYACRVFFGSDATATFAECWQPMLAMVSTELDAQLAACSDVVAVLLMTRIVSHAQLQMTHAQVPVLGGFLDRLGLMLWPHFSRLIREHIASITVGAQLQCARLLLSLSLAIGAMHYRTCDTPEPYSFVCPHAIQRDKESCLADKQNAKARALKPATPCVLPPTRRWAQLFSSIARLNAEYGESQIHNNLEELAKAMQARPALSMSSVCLFHGNLILLRCHVCAACKRAWLLEAYSAQWRAHACRSQFPLHPSSLRVPPL